MLNIISHVNWLALGLIVGLWWGAFAVIEFSPHPLPWWKKHRHLEKPDDPEPKDLINHPCCKWGRRRSIARSIVYPIYQFFFNFIGGFAGCLALGLFFHRFTHHHLGWPELVLLFLALAGVMGKFSEVMFILPRAVNAWASRQDRAKS